MATSSLASFLFLFLCLYIERTAGSPLGTARPVSTADNGSNLNQQSLATRAGSILTARTSERVSGWVSTPNVRGTWDILWTSLATIFLCTYTLLCLNVPARTDGFFALLRRRILWMCLATIAPEIVLTYAAGQWSRAQHSIAAFRASGISSWTARLAFFADMGGFVLHAPGAEPFPLNAKQLHWLVVNKHIQYPAISTEEIWDKSKQDRMTKGITAFQIVYIIVGYIGRVANGLAITTLELNTLGIVVCSLMTAFAWFHKPSDVYHPIHIHTTVPIDVMVNGRPWTNTPLDFVDENGPGWSMNVQPFMRMPVLPAARPLQRIPNDRFPMDPYGIQEYCLCFATLLFTGIHVAGWNFVFPTPLEALLWKVCSLVLFGVTALFWVLETAASWIRLGRWTRLYLQLFDPLALDDFDRQQAARLSNEKPREMTTLPLPWEFWTIAPIAVLYGVARLYMLIEGFIELRDADATAYMTVDWSSYIPHI